jgi:predicted secreted protein
MPPKTKKPSFFKEKRDFISRMLDGKKPSNYSLDMVAAKKVFDQFDNDTDFLSKVKPPFKMVDSIKYFITSDGMKYLKKKYNEFKFEIPEHEIPVDLGEKAGEDIEINKPITIRNFLL